MSKHKRSRSAPTLPAAERQTAAARQKAAKAPAATSSSRLRRIPLWGWALIFLLPLALSEYMFYRAGRSANMFLFPIAWIGFWAAILYRYWWPSVKERLGR